ncbi:acyl-CoA thioesterase [Mucilaginibacter sp. KACC 22063]|uniref:acyl-CoA thioesterase n=1 Tax=Mucilaginibacter sp. KACC 22063 TaxID=3025666 RepID=UPI0023668529|nr:thioesterase family protein [Mucilaginibacter sp. KACC 22063]WDF53615.1 thioesterase family protein [Mucilaginibacter sp. KACC 22063]
MAENISDYNFRFPISIRFSDIDAYGNVSNTIYLTFFEIARLNYWKDVTQWDFKKAGVILGRSEINYLKPITIDDTICCYVRTSRIGNSSFDMLYLLTRNTPDGEEICTTGKSVCISYDYDAKESVPIPENERQRMIEYDKPGLITNTH